MIKKLLLAVLGLAVLVIAFGLFKTFQEPKDLWVTTGKFADCPEGANCVSSNATDEAHQIAPLGYPGSDMIEVREKLGKAALSVPGARVETATPEYLHIVYQSPLMHLRDDVELLIEPAVVQVRSISRLGYGDQSAHRERVDKIRAAFEAQFVTPG